MYFIPSCQSTQSYSHDTIVSTMTVLGVDPGFDRAGFGIVEDISDKQKLIDSGCLVTRRTAQESVRLLDLYQQITKLLEKHSIDTIALESLFFTTNAKTVIGVGQARGVILLSAAQKNIPVVTYAPLQVKLAISGYGKAEKSQIQQMVKSILHLKDIPKPDDAADAIAIALTHCFSYKMSEMSNAKMPNEFCR